MQSYHSSHNKDDHTLTMSNAISPSALQEVTRGQTPPKPEYTGEVTEQDVFPFLVASQESVTNGEPPEVDNAKLARQKRKRTRYVRHYSTLDRSLSSHLGHLNVSICVYTDMPFSPEDQATLEAEYKKNPKPDKMARIAIVEQVSLGEKEVQVRSP